MLERPFIMEGNDMFNLSYYFCPMSVLQQYFSDIFRLCREHQVKTLYAFGSVLTSKFSSESDVDFIVNFEARELNGYADNYFDLKSSLEQVLQRPVDLLEEKAIKNPYFKQAVVAHRELIYAS